MPRTRIALCCGPRPQVIKASVRRSYGMGTPCVTLRRETERIETVEENAYGISDTAPRLGAVLEPLVG